MNNGELVTFSYFWDCGHSILTVIRRQGLLDIRCLNLLQIRDNVKRKASV